MKEQHLLENINNKSNFQLFAFSFLCFIAFTYNLGEVPPYHADENFYVTSSRNMIDSGDYITPMYHGKKRFAKPILFYWMVSASYKTFGINLFSARLVSAFFGALCIPIVYITARRLFDHKTAIISSLILPGCYLHFQISRWAITDMALNFFILSTFYFFIRGFQDKKNKSTSYCLMYICMGIGFMIKGPPSIIIPTLVIGCFIFMSQNREEFRQLKFLYGLVILLVIIFPWFAKMLKMHGDEFKNHILGAEIRDRVIHNTPYSLYYFGVVVRYYLPWSFFFIAALANKFDPTSTPSLSTHSQKKYFSFVPAKLKILYKDMTLKNNQGLLFSILWIAWPLIVFTLFRIEHSRYMLPISAPIVMITAQFLSQFICSPNRFQDRVFKISFYLTMVFYLLIIILVAAGVVLLTSHFKAPTELIVLSILSLLGLVAILVFYKFEKKIYMIVALSISQIIILTTLSGDALPYFNRYPMKLFANKILSDPQENKHIGLYQLGNNRARMGLMTGLPTISLKKPDELKRFIDSKEAVYIIMRQSEWKENFNNLPMTIQAMDTAWKKSVMTKVKIRSLLVDGLAFSKNEYLESYALLKK